MRNDHENRVTRSARLRQGTQAKAIVDTYHITDIATGDLLRAEVAAGTPLGLQAKPLMEAGEFVPDEIVVGMIKEHLAKDDTSNGFLLDGFPRDLPQAEALDAMLTKINQPLDVVLYFKVDYGEIMTRLLARHRMDDTAETIRHRLEIYEAKTAPLIDRYKSKGLIREVNGIGEITEVTARIFAILDDIAANLATSRQSN
ncbi:MAG: adenylate kinase [Candidatus Competibacteraceae bacterium]